MDWNELPKYIKSLGSIWLVIAGAVIAFAIYAFNPITPISALKDAYNSNVESKNLLKVKQFEYEKIKEMAERKAARPKHLEKIVYEPTDLQLGSGASFAEPFENMIDIAKDSKIRIKSITYNYAPDQDPIFKSELAGYNVCEMNIVAIGSYSQIKSFFSGMLSQIYLSKISDIQMEPWGYDKSILVANFKLTLYTKT